MIRMGRHSLKSIIQRTISILILSHGIKNILYLIKTKSTRAFCKRDSIGFPVFIYFEDVIIDLFPFQNTIAIAAQYTRNTRLRNIDSCHIRN